MATQLALTTLVVPDYDAGIAFFVGALGFDLIEDTDMGEGKRWVVVGGKGGGAVAARPRRQYSAGCRDR